MEVSALAGAAIYVADGVSLLAVAVGAAVDAEPEVIVEELAGVSAMVVDESGVYAAATGSVFQLRPGAPPRELARGQTEVTSLAVDATHVYWTDHDPDPDGGSPYVSQGLRISGDGAVRRVAKAGGAVEDLATRQPSPMGVALHAGRVWWSTERGVGLRSLVAGGERRVRPELPGRAMGVAADARGVVAVTGAGGLGSLLVEKVDGGPARVLAASDATFMLMPRAPVLAPDWAYVLALRQDVGTYAILAVPRRDQGVALAIGVDEQLLAMHAHDGAIYWAETTRSGSGESSFWRASPTDGTRRRIGRGTGWFQDFTIHGDHVYFAEDSVIQKLPLAGGKPTVVRYTDGAVYGLTAHRRHLFWLTGSALMAMRRGGGEPFELARNDNGYYGGDARADLLFDDDYIYTTAFGSGGAGVYRVSERGEVSTLWTASDSGDAYPGPQLLRLGDELWFSSGGTAVQAVSTSGRDAHQVGSFGGGAVIDLVEGNGLAYVLVQRYDVGEQYELIRLTPGVDEPVTVMRWLSGYGGEQPRLSADNRAAYLYTDALGGFVVIAHGAAGLPAPQPAP